MECAIGLNLERGRLVSIWNAGGSAAVFLCFCGDFHFFLFSFCGCVFLLVFSSSGCFSSGGFFVGGDFFLLELFWFVFFGTRPFMSLSRSHMLGSVFFFFFGGVFIYFFFCFLFLRVFRAGVCSRCFFFLLELFGCVVLFFPDVFLFIFSLRGKI